jgi:hypothetical protein
MVTADLGLQTMKTHRNGPIHEPPLSTKAPNHYSVVESLLCRDLLRPIDIQPHQSVEVLFSTQSGDFMSFSMINIKKPPTRKKSLRSGRAMGKMLTNINWCSLLQVGPF